MSLLFSFRITFLSSSPWSSSSKSSLFVFSFLSFVLLPTVMAARYGYSWNYLHVSERPTDMVFGGQLVKGSTDGLDSPADSRENESKFQLSRIIVMWRMYFLFLKIRFQVYDRCSWMGFWFTAANGPSILLLATAGSGTCVRLLPLLSFRLVTTENYQWKIECFLEDLFLYRLEIECLFWKMKQKRKCTRLSFILREITEHYMEILSEGFFFSPFQQTSDRVSIPSREVSILWSYLDITLLFSSYVYLIFFFFFFFLFSLLVYDRLGWKIRTLRTVYPWNRRRLEDNHGYGCTSTLGSITNR